MEQDEKSPEVDPRLAVRFYALAAKAYQSPTGATVDDPITLASALRRAQKQFTAVDIANRILEAPPEMRSATESHLVDCARRCLEAEAEIFSLRLRYSQQADNWRTTYRESFEEYFVSAINGILRTETAAIMRLSDGDLSALQSLIARHARPASAELISALDEPVYLDPTGLDADSAFEALVTQCEPRETVNSMAQFMRDRIECDPDEVISHIKNGLSTLRPLAETLVEIAEAKGQLDNLAQAEEAAYNDVLATYAQERWDNASPRLS